MEDKTYTQVNLLGKDYCLGGEEDEAYLQRVATYVNGKQAELKKMQGYFRQNTDFRNMLLILNLADDYFKAQEKIRQLEERQSRYEREIYGLKHELVTSRLRQDKEE